MGLTWIRLFSLFQLPGSLASSGAMGHPADYHNSSPQAVFTSFKLPKPGSAASAAAAAAVTTAVSSPSLLRPSPAVMSSPLGAMMAAGGMLPDLSKFNPNNPLGLPTPVSQSSKPPNILSAPLGGLPAMASQLQAAAARMKAEDAAAALAGEDLDRGSNHSASPGPPGTPRTPPPSATKRVSNNTSIGSGEGEPNNSSADEGSPPKNQGLIKARGTYYPLTAFPTSMPQGPVMRREDGSPPRTEASNSGKWIIRSGPFFRHAWMDVVALHNLFAE